MRNTQTESKTMIDQQSYPWLVIAAVLMLFNHPDQGTSHNNAICVWGQSSYLGCCADAKAYGQGMAHLLPRAV